MKWSVAQWAPGSPPARQQSPRRAGAALRGSRQVPSPKRVCARGRVAPLCPLAGASLAGLGAVCAGSACAAPARQEGPGDVGAALHGPGHAPCPRRECAPGRGAPLCLLTGASLAGVCQEDASQRVYCAGAAGGPQRCGRCPPWARARPLPKARVRARTGCAGVPSRRRGTCMHAGFDASNHGVCECSSDQDLCSDVQIHVYCFRFICTLQYKNTKE